MEIDDFEWCGVSERAAQMVAVGRLSYADIAGELQIDPATLWRWRQDPGFKARVEEHLEDIRSEVRRVGLADLYHRVEALDSRWREMQRVIEERAVDPTMAGVPGGTTGLLVRTVRKVVVEDESRDGGGRKTSREVCEYALDTGLLKELREHERQAAQELGQWLEKTESKVNVGAIQPIRIVEVRVAEPRALMEVVGG
jgi:transposase-like protein